MTLIILHIGVRYQCGQPNEGSPFFGLAVFGFLRIDVGLTKPFIAKYH